MIIRSRKAGTTPEPHLEAKLALLRMQAHLIIERTDASARRVEEALVHFARAGSTGDAPTKL
jgi:hypothetical protein